MTQNNFLLHVNLLFNGNPSEFELMKFYSKIEQWATLEAAKEGSKKLKKWQDFLEIILYYMQKSFFCFPRKVILTKNIEEGKVQRSDHSGFSVWVGKMLMKE